MPGKLKIRRAPLPRAAARPAICTLRRNPNKPLIRIPYFQASAPLSVCICQTDILYHISKLALRVPLVFTKKHGIYAARLMLRLRLAFTNRTYYTMTLQSGLNKTAPAAVLHGSMFSKPCAPAQGRVQRTRAAAQTAALRLWLYHISKLTLRAPLVFNKKHGIYTAKFILRLRLAFAKRTYYTINMAAAKEFYRRKARRAHIFTLRPACALISGAAGTRCVRQCPRRCL